MECVSRDTGQPAEPSRSARTLRDRLGALLGLATAILVAALVLAMLIAPVVFTIVCFWPRAWW